MCANICIPNARGENVRANNEERWWGASEAFASPLCHRKPLNYSVSLKYWYGNHSWLNWRRTAGKKKEKGAAKIYCPSSTVLSSFSLLLFHWWLLMVASCSSLFHVCFTQDAANAEERLPAQWVSHWQRKKTPCALWALDVETRHLTEVWPRISITKVQVHVLTQHSKSKGSSSVFFLWR